MTLAVHLSQLSTDCRSEEVADSERRRKFVTLSREQNYWLMCATSLFDCRSEEAAEAERRRK